MLWIHERDIDVVVDNWCFSSCANYIFTAAKNKTIKAGAIVGWHGSGTANRIHHPKEWIDSRGSSELETYAQRVARSGIAPTDEGRMEFIEDLKDDIPIEVMEEREFLEEIGVSVEVMVYGILPEPYKKWSVSGNLGWAFSIEDMAKFGIDNVTYEGEGSNISMRNARRSATFCSSRCRESRLGG